MSFADLFLFSVVVYSITFGYMESPIFSELRKFVVKNIHRAYGECYHCSGFWISMMTAIFWPDVTFGRVVAFAFFGSGMIVVFDKLVTYLYRSSLPNEVRLEEWRKEEQTNESQK